MKGSFTGAIADQRGLFVAADKGTLFLDEIGDMPLPLQVKLLRVIETREVRPIGAEQSNTSIVYDDALASRRGAGGCVGKARACAEALGSGS